MNVKDTLALFLACSLSTGIMAQGKGKLVDHRDQAEGWFVPMHGQAMVQGNPAGPVDLILYRENEKIGEMRSKKNGRFELELDIDQVYSLRVIKNGMQEKLIHIDTNLPKDLLDYPDYLMYVNLQPVDKKNIDPFYTDFPSAIIRFDAEKGGFYHSDNYLTHIQTRLAGYARATF